MFRALRACLILLTSSAAAPAAAQQVDFDGALRVGASGLYGGEGIGAADFIAGFDFFRDTPLGAELGFYGFAGRAGRPHETYVALVWNDRWRVGAARSAYDRVLTSAFDRTAPLLASNRVEYTRALATVEPIRRGAVPWGLSYAGRIGRTRLAVSAHRAVKGDFTALGLAVERRWQGAGLAAAVEGVWAGTGTTGGLNAKIGGDATLGRARLGLAYLHPDANARSDAVALDLSYAVRPRLALLAFGEFTLDNGDDAYGLGADFVMRDSTSVLISLTDSTGGQAAHFTLEQRF